VLFSFYNQQTKRLMCFLQAGGRELHRFAYSMAKQAMGKLQGKEKRK
jgi:hypothetical protein